MECKPVWPAALNNAENVGKAKLEACAAKSLGTTAPLLVISELQIGVSSLAMMQLKGLAALPSPSQAMSATHGANVVPVVSRVILELAAWQLWSERQESCRDLTTHSCIGKARAVRLTNDVDDDTAFRATTSCR